MDSEESFSLSCELACAVISATGGPADEFAEKFELTSTEEDGMDLNW